MITSNGRPGDPLAASQYAINGVFTTTLRLQGVNRFSGQYFPTISGDFLRVESCDLPVRIGFGNVGSDDCIAVVPGDTFRGRFAGITLYHDNYAGSAATSDVPEMRLTVGRGVSLEKSSENRAVPYGVFSRTTAATTSSHSAVLYVPAKYNRIFGQIVAVAESPGGDLNTRLNISGPNVASDVVVGGQTYFGSAILRSYEGLARLDPVSGFVEVSYDVDLHIGNVDFLNVEFTSIGAATDLWGLSFGLSLQ